MNKLDVVMMVGLALLTGRASAQSELGQLTDKLKDVIKTEKPLWKCKRSEGAFGATNVQIVHCSLSNRSVNIAIQAHDSVADAQRALQQFVNRDSQRRQLRDLGDEAWWLGDNAPDVALRKGRFTVSIRTWARVAADPDASKLSYAEREARAKGACK